MAPGTDDNQPAAGFDPRRVKALRALVRTDATIGSIRREPALLEIVREIDPGASPARHARMLLEALAGIIGEARSQVLKAQAQRRTGTVDTAASIAAAGEMLGLGDDKQLLSLFENEERVRQRQDFEAKLRSLKGLAYKKRRATEWFGTISKKTAERGVEHWMSVLLAALEDHFGRMQAAGAKQDRVPRHGMDAVIARTIIMSGPVEKALNAAQMSCEARGRDVYTLDLLLALLNLPSGHVSECFDAIETALASRTRAWLLTWEAQISQSGRGSLQPRKWVEYPAVQRALNLVAADNGAILDEIYLLLGILDTESNARHHLAPHVDLERLRDEARARRQTSRRLITPDPSNIEWPSALEDLHGPGA